MAGDCARVVAARVHVGPNHAGDSRVPACRHLSIASGGLGARINRRSERAGGLRFESYRPGCDEVFGEDDLRTNGRLNPEGNLRVPLLGSIHLAGLTLTQAVSKLTELYSRDYLVNPKINVTLLGYAKRRVSILGQVNRAGIIDLPEDSPQEGIDLLEAIALAGGYTRIASPERITVRRHNASGDQIFKVNAKRFTKGKGGSFLVKPGDTITVGESIF